VRDASIIRVFVQRRRSRCGCVGEKAKSISLNGGSLLRLANLDSVARVLLTTGDPYGYCDHKVELIHSRGTSGCRSHGQLRRVRTKFRSTG